MTVELSDPPAAQGKEEGMAMQIRSLIEALNNSLSINQQFVNKAPQHDFIEESGVKAAYQRSANRLSELLSVAKQRYTSFVTEFQELSKLRSKTRHESQKKEQQQGLLASRINEFTIMYQSEFECEKEQLLEIIRRCRESKLHKRKSEQQDIAVNLLVDVQGPDGDCISTAAHLRAAYGAIFEKLRVIRIQCKELESHKMQVLKAYASIVSKHKEVVRTRNRWKVLRERESKIQDAILENKRTQDYYFNWRLNTKKWALSTMETLGKYRVGYMEKQRLTSKAEAVYQCIERVTMFRHRVSILNLLERMRDAHERLSTLSKTLQKRIAGVKIKYNQFPSLESEMGNVTRKLKGYEDLLGRLSLLRQRISDQNDNRQREKEMHCLVERRRNAESQLRQVLQRLEDAKRKHKEEQYNVTLQIKKFEGIRSALRELFRKKRKLLQERADMPAEALIEQQNEFKAVLREYKQLVECSEKLIENSRKSVEAMNNSTAYTKVYQCSAAALEDLETQKVKVFRLECQKNVDAVKEERHTVVEIMEQYKKNYNTIIGAIPGCQLETGTGPLSAQSPTVEPEELAASQPFDNNEVERKVEDASGIPAGRAGAKLK